MTLIPLDKIRIDCDTQSRASLNHEVVREYAEEMLEGKSFPPVDVFFDGKFYFLCDGFHRYHAKSKLGHKEIECNIHNGTLRDAIYNSAGKNDDHGLRRTNADKRKIVTTFLNDPEWSEMTYREIASVCKVSHQFVSKVHEEMGNVKKEKPVKQKQPLEEPVDPRDEIILNLSKENAQLSDQLATGLMEGTDEDKQVAKQTIEQLREDYRLIEIELRSVKKSRDQFQNENAQLKRQVAMLQKKLKQYE